ncbi:MAG TPA: hypothetical protein VKN99_18365 [Polyangia bacterium]|nr:hypothetical protein [Polyangia bacterium]
MKERKDRDDRKERVIHARIPASLEAEIKRLADGLRIPVSNLVRNILQDTVAMVDGMHENVEGAITRLRSSLGRLESRVEKAVRPAAASPRPPAGPPEPRNPLADVFGWQEIVLNQDARCAKCELILTKGFSAFFGLTGRPDDRIFACARCVPRRPVRSGTTLT